MLARQLMLTSARQAASLRRKTKQQAQSIADASVEQTRESRSKAFIVLSQNHSPQTLDAQAGRKRRACAEHEAPKLPPHHPPPYPHPPLHPRLHPPPQPPPPLTARAG